jgi:hypothetical protein
MTKIGDISELVIPSNIPWSDVKGQDLEELIYWLLDDMGARELQWRRGGICGSSADSGRDLEAIFHVPTPDGEISVEKWWVQAKGRERRVEPRAVKETLNNVSAVSDVRILIIATNADYSNPTKDWVVDWQKSHPLPVVRLWSRHDLERIVSRRPSVVARLFPDALSDQGKLEVLSSRFWNQHYLSGSKTLSELWNHRTALKIGEEHMLALLVSEMANGDIGIHQWTSTLDDKGIEKLLVLTLANVPFLSSRAEDYGVGQDHLLDTTAFVVELAVTKLEFGRAFSLFDDPWKHAGLGARSDDFRRYLRGVIVSRMKWTLAEACSRDCSRVSIDGSQDRLYTNFWLRYRAEVSEATTGSAEVNDTLIIENTEKPCDVGLFLGKGHGCPLIEDVHAEHLSGESAREFSLKVRAIIQYHLKRQPA